MFSLKCLMTHCRLAVINLVPIGDLCTFGVQYGVGKTVLFDLINCWINQDVFYYKNLLICTFY